MYKIKKGLNIPLFGQAVGDVKVMRSNHVAVLGCDYIGMKPTMMVKLGDVVKRGQALFEDKKNPGVFFTAPIAGRISAIHRGDKRALLAVVIERSDDAAISFKQGKASELSRQEIVDNLLRSGLWTSFRTRPYSKIPAVDAKPHSIFVTAIDTNPLAVDPAMIIAKAQQAFDTGLAIVAKLTTGKTYLCQDLKSNLATAPSGIEVVAFSGVHPAGLVGTHIHLLDPVNAHKTVWHLNYQDIIAIGKLFMTGELDLTRIISVAGPAAKSPAFVQTDMGASFAELLTEQGGDDARVRQINGSVLSGAFVCEETAYLGKYALQISLLFEGTEKKLFGWLLPDKNKFAITRMRLAATGDAERALPLTTSSEGSPRSMVPIGVYEKVMPLDILPTLLLKALIIKDTDEAQRLGALELDEEDLALCTFVCPSKYEYGAILRENLEKIEREG